MYAWFFICTYIIEHMIHLRKYHPRPFVFDCGPFTDFDVLAFCWETKVIMCFYTLRCISTAKYFQIVIVFLSLQRPKGVREYYKVFLYHKTWFHVLLEILLYTLLISFNLFQKNDYMRGFIPYRKVLRRSSWSIGVYAPSGAFAPTGVDRHYKVSLFSQRPQRC